MLVGRTEASHREVPVVCGHSCCNCAANFDCKNVAERGMHKLYLGLRSLDFQGRRT